MKKKLIASVLIILTFWGLMNFLNVFQNNKTSSCINLYVDFNKLLDQTKISKCIPENDKTVAIKLIKDANLMVEGTQTYGLSVICRVQNLPGPMDEKCLKMPPENAYWAILVKSKGNIADPFPKWGWAKTGASEVYLYPGDSLGLVFVTDGKVNWPN